MVVSVSRFLGHVTADKREIGDVCGTLSRQCKNAQVICVSTSITKFRLQKMSEKVQLDGYANLVRIYYVVRNQGRDDNGGLKHGECEKKILSCD